MNGYLRDTARAVTPKISTTRDRKFTWVDNPSAFAAAKKSRILWLGNVKTNWSPEFIAELLSEIPPTHVKLLYSHQSGKPLAYSFLLYASEEDAARALHLFSGRQVVFHSAILGGMMRIVVKLHFSDQHISLFDAVPPLAPLPQAMLPALPALPGAPSIPGTCLPSQRPTPSSSPSPHPIYGCPPLQVAVPSLWAGQNFTPEPFQLQPAQCSCPYNFYEGQSQSFISYQPPMQYYNNFF